MDVESPEHSFIARSMKGLDKFVSSGKQYSIPSSKSYNVNNTACMQLNFSGNETILEDHDFSSSFNTSKKRKRDDSQSLLKKHQESVIGLDVCKAMRDKDAELIEANANLTRLKNQLAEAETQMSKMTVHYDTELSRHRLANLKLQETVDEQAMKARQQRSQAEATAAEAERRRREAVGGLTEALQQAKARLAETGGANADLTKRLAAAQAELQNTAAKLKYKTSALDVAEAELSSLRAQGEAAAAARAGLAEELGRLDDLQLAVERLTAANRELEGRLESVAEKEKFAELFERSVTKMPELERRCSKLQEENDMFRTCSVNTRLLEAQLAGARQEAEQLQQEARHAAQLQAQLQHAQAELAEMQAALRAGLGLDAAPPVAELAPILRGLREREEGELGGIRAMRDSVAAHEKQSQSLSGQLEALKARLAAADEASQRGQALARRQQRKNGLLARERDALKEVLASYEAEATMTAATATGHTRIVGLEEALRRSRAEMAVLEADLDRYEGLPGAGAGLGRAGRAQLEALQAELGGVREQLQAVQQEKEVLEYRLEQRALKGDYDPSQEKVLHLTNNPTAEAREGYKAEVERLEAEIQRLRDERSETTILAASEAERAKTEAVQRQLDSMLVKEQRLMKVFEEKTRRMRSLVYRLTGYSVTPDGDDCYRLTSCYATSDQDYFSFQMSREGEIRLLSTDFSTSVADFVEIYLSQEHSYPAFLSAVTIDLFDKKNMRERGQPSEHDSDEAAERAHYTDDDSGSGSDDSSDEERSEPPQDDDDDDLICLD